MADTAAREERGEEEEKKKLGLKANQKKLTKKVCTVLYMYLHVHIHKTHTLDKTYIHTYALTKKVCTVLYMYLHVPVHVHACTGMHCIEVQMFVW